MTERTLVYFTNNYPLGGTTEEAFMKSEILVLSRAFSRLLVVPMRKGADCLDISFWPDNVSLDTRLSELPREQGKLRYVYLLNPYLAMAVLRDCRVLKNRFLLNYLIQSFQEGLAVRSYCLELFKKVPPPVFYTFWFAETSIGLGLLPKRKIQKWITRAHRYDLYDDCVPVRSKLFRTRAFRNVTKVLACSNQGADYLSIHYPRWKDKIGTLYLGTHQPSHIPDYSYDSKVINFITIARMESVKRPLMTFDILNDFAGSYPDKHIIWTVVGGGSMEQSLRTLADSASRDNFEVRMLGEMPNADIHKLLSSHSFDWIVMLSESEGLPISLAEAMSYGIPAIATDVGGVKEEVLTGVSGLLLSSNPCTDEFVSAIKPYVNDSQLYLQLREQALAFWRDNLNETVLKQTLAKLLVN